MSEPKNENPPAKSSSNTLPYFLSAITTVLMSLILYTQGRIWWCKLGDYSLWVSEAWGNHTSQHLFDPYTFTHILHGVLFFWLIDLIFKKQTFAWKFFISIFVESAWEVLENSRYIIEKYRENTASLDYFGDSIFNSIGDVIACGIGFYVAFKLKFWRSLIFFIVTEIVLLIFIRDGLLLNILMLIYPIDGIKQWQTGA